MKFTFPRIQHNIIEALGILKLQLQQCPRTQAQDTKKPPKQLQNGGNSHTSKCGDEHSEPPLNIRRKDFFQMYLKEFKTQQ